MSAPRPSGGSFDDSLTNLALTGLSAIVALAGVLGLAGTIAAVLTGHAQPTGGPEAGLGVLVHPADPGRPLGVPDLNPVAYWAVVAVLLATVTAATGWAWSLIRDHGRREKTDPYRIPGSATRAEVARTASDTALLRRAATLRPSMDAPRPTDVGYLLGTAHGKRVWASVEDSILLIGPPRSGKGNPHRHQHHPRCPRRGRDHQHPSGQPHRHPACAGAPGTRGRVRPSTARPGTARRAAVVARQEL